MIIATVEINQWEKLSAANTGGLTLSIGDFAVINTEYGEEAGKIVELKEVGEEEAKAVSNSVERLAKTDDWEALLKNRQDKDKVIQDCRETVKRYDLEMKIVDAHFSLDGQRLSFAFIADGRIDFRELVKELSRTFNRVIRLQQIGVRDEAKLVGDVGSCGLGQCCRSHLKKLGNVSSDFAEDQQIVHRGAERLSGICGRLKCCLAYEESYYQDLIAKLPALGTKVKTKHGRGAVVGWHVLRCSVDVELDKERDQDKAVIVEVPITKD
ncbi:MAG: regulatory iron-sulfur-containing complex subunit RicT [Candidatus Buchananbacteria bacterium]